MRSSPQMLEVLRCLLEAPEPCRVRTGYEIMRDTGLNNSTVYQILHRLEEAGWLVSGEEPATEKGRPPRRCYRFTDLGLESAKGLDP